jgi:hypothetical protein
LVIIAPERVVSTAGSARASIDNKEDQVMAAQLADEIMEKLRYARSLYDRLLLVVGPEGSGKTSALREVGHRVGAAVANVNLELSRRLLDLTEQQRAIQIGRHLNRIVGMSQTTVIILDNIELLFDVGLKQDPLRLLQGLSRSRTVVAAWSGSIEDGYLTYADARHPEYRRYPIGDLLVANATAD